MDDIAARRPVGKSPSEITVHEGLSHFRGSMPADPLANRPGRENGTVPFGSGRAVNGCPFESSIPTA